VSEKVKEEFLEAVPDDYSKSLITTATGSCLPSLKTTNKPRFIKTHIPISLLHPNLLSCGAKVSMYSYIHGKGKYQRKIVCSSYRTTIIALRFRYLPIS